MNWDLLIGVITGGSISLINIVGSIITNRQNNTHALEKQKQTMVLENSFKEYEFRTNLAKELVAEGQTATLYPYDMYLVTYTKIAEYLKKDQLTESDLQNMLREMNEIHDAYILYNNRTT